jgi:DNA-directed RNA polymerase specialized sigma24 family protein
MAASVWVEMRAGLGITEAFEKWGDDLTRYATVLVGAADAADVVSQAFTDAVTHLELLSDPDVIAAVNALSLQQRSVIYLTYWEDMTPAAIAGVLGVSDGTIRRHLARGRSRLRKVLS